MALTLGTDLTAQTNNGTVINLTANPPSDSNPGVCLVLLHRGDDLAAWTAPADGHTWTKQFENYDAGSSSSSWLTLFTTTYNNAEGTGGNWDSHAPSNHHLVGRMFHVFGDPTVTESSLVVGSTHAADHPVSGSSFDQTLSAESSLTNKLVEIVVSTFEQTRLSLGGYDDQTITLDGTLTSFGTFTNFLSTGQGQRRGDSVAYRTSSVGAAATNTWGYGGTTAWPYFHMMRICLGTVGQDHWAWAEQGLDSWQVV